MVGPLVATLALSLLGFVQARPPREALQLAQRDIDSSRPDDWGGNGWGGRGGGRGGMGGGNMVGGMLGGLVIGSLLGDIFDGCPVPPRPVS